NVGAGTMPMPTAPKASAGTEGEGMPGTPLPLRFTVTEGCSLSLLVTINESFARPSVLGVNSILTVIMPTGGMLNAPALETMLKGEPGPAGAPTFPVSARFALRFWIRKALCFGNPPSPALGKTTGLGEMAIVPPGVGVAEGVGVGTFTFTGSDAIPFATTTKVLEPNSVPAGTSNSVETGVLPVAMAIVL